MFKVDEESGMAKVVVLDGDFIAADRMARRGREVHCEARSKV